ncbi:MAG: serine/threonine protein kinase/lipopolysaccharide biosynthesis regulator YciM [Mariniblastus sp.]|jgi:serine/threonine protein kinase/lipopolysaccharide biosynthesis regulator YciM
MSELSEFDDLSNDQMQVVDSFCMSFERAQRSGTADSIEQVLGSVPKDLQSAVFQELLAIELEWLRSKSAELDIANYLERFPDQHEEIHRLVNASEAHESNLIGTAPVNGVSIRCPTSVDPSGGTVIDDRYTIIEPIGEGGMGAVFLAEQHTPVKRQVAIKFIRGGMDSKAVLARFDIERNSLALMDHPGIAQVYDGGQSADGLPYFVMELVRGVPITRYCDEKSLDVRARLKLFVSVCKSVQHAHLKGIIHRDLKPGNILVSEVDGEPFSKVIDFGVAKAVDRKLTEKSLAATDMIVGTPAYMSPEQADPMSMDIDMRTDVYSLGVVLFELLVGTPPYDAADLPGGSIFDFLRKVRESDSPRPSTKVNSAAKLTEIAADRRVEPEKLARLLRGELDWIALKALEKDRSRRYETVNGFSRDVERYLAGDVVEARPPSNAYRLKKIMARNKGMVLAASLLFLTLSAGVIGTGWGMLEAQANAEAARLETVEKEAARENEVRERKYAEAVAEFVEKDFLALTTLRGRLDNDGDESLINKDSTLRDLLDRADEKLNSRTDLAPRIEGRLRWMIGKSYQRLHEFEFAIESLERSVDRYTEVFGKDHFDTLQAQYGLAEALQENGQYGRALTLLTDTIARMKSLLGPEHDATLKSVGLLAGNYRFTGEPAKAVRILEDLLAISKSRYGEKDRQTLVGMYELALAYKSADQSNKAVKLLEKTLQLQTETLDENHPDIDACRSELGGLYLNLGQHKKARPLLEQGLEWSKANYGPDHNRTIYSRVSLTRLYCYLREQDLALPMALENLEITKNAFAPDHPNIAKAMYELAMVYHSGGDYAQALSWFEKVLEKCKADLSENHPFTMVAMANVASCLRKVGQLAEAQKINEASLKMAKEVWGDDHSKTVDIKSGLAGGYWRQGNLARSVPLFEEVLKFQESKNGRNHPNTLLAIANLGVNYRDAGRFDESVALLEEAYRAIPNMPELGSFGPELLDAYLKAGQVDKGLALVIDLVKDARRRLPEGSLKLSTSLTQIGRFLLEGDLAKGAEPLLRESVAIQLQLASESSDTYAGVALLGEALVRQEKLAEGEERLVQAAEGMKRFADATAGSMQNRLVEVVKQLIDLATALDRPDDVAKWEAELALLRAGSGLDDPN